MVKQNHEWGIALSFAGYSAWVIGDVFVKLAGQTLTAMQILTVNFFVGIFFMLALAGVNGGVRQLASKRPWFQSLSSVLVMAASFGSVVGVMYLSLTDFYMIIFTSPLIMTVLGSLFLKEKTDYQIWLAILFGFLGVLIAVRFSQNGVHELSWVGVGATCLASLALSLSMIVVRAAPGENNYALGFWPRVFSFIASLILLVWLGETGHWDIAGSFYAVLAGIMGALGVFLTNLSLRYAPMSVVSPYHYTQIIGGAVAGYLIWHHVPTLPVVIGAGMITVSGLFILWHQKFSPQGKLEDRVGI